MIILLLYKPEKYENLEFSSDHPNYITKVIHSKEPLFAHHYISTGLWER
jgi:hypothetical protein